ncbi:hypothetical protein JCM3770_003378 [Rhodotorula araucariae]
MLHGSRLEGKALYSAGALRALERATSRCASTTLNEFAKAIKTAEPAPAPAATAAAAAPPAAPAAAGDQAPADDEAPRRHRLYDHDDPVAIESLATLMAAHPVVCAHRHRGKEQRTAEIRRVCSEFAHGLTGGAQRPDNPIQAHCLVFVGQETSSQSGSSREAKGADSRGRLLRELEVALKATGVKCKFVLSNEFMTSQRCPKPTVHPRREDGSEVLRLAHCPSCSGVFNRDGAGAANILAMGLCFCGLPNDAGDMPPGLLGSPLNPGGGPPLPPLASRADVTALPVAHLAAWLAFYEIAPTGRVADDREALETWCMCG